MGVPLFQEQAMKIAIVGAGFAPEEADRLRRAMATFKRNGDIHLFRDKFIAGMAANGYDRDFATRCFSQIEGFGTYGFPESHAASFALLGLRLGLDQMLLSRNLRLRLAQQPADGVLRPGADRPRRPRARGRGARRRRQPQLLGLHVGAVRGGKPLSALQGGEGGAHRAPMGG